MADDRIKQALVEDHAELYDPVLARRYFDKFARIGAHLGRVAAELEAEGKFARDETRVLAGYLKAVIATFHTLSLKYLMTGRSEGAPRLTIDRHESGFPVAQELMLMAVDAQQAQKHLAGMPGEAELKDRMVARILGDLTTPVALQFALSQRLYYQSLQEGGLFWGRNDPDALWRGERNDRRRYLVHWAVWDTQVNLPVVYLMDLEDSGRRALPTDPARWLAMQQNMLAQSLAGLKLLTLATGFDKDFEDCHPRRLRRITLGPMYSASFTMQSGPISHVLVDARAPAGDDWALVWSIEDLVADREETVKDGWFSSRPRQVYRLDPVKGAELGATALERMIILPERPYQVLVEQDPPGMRGIRKFVVGAGGRLIPAR